jgi:hypothetical protein
MADVSERALKSQQLRGDFQADDEGSIPFTPANVSNGLVTAAAAASIPTTRLLLILTTVHHSFAPRAARLASIFKMMDVIRHKAWTPYGATFATRARSGIVPVRVCCDRKVLTATPAVGKNRQSATRRTRRG